MKIYFGTCQSVKYDHLGECSPETNCGDIDHSDDDDFRSGCQNVSQCHHKQSFSGLHSPGWSYFTDLWYDSRVQTIYSIRYLAGKVKS